MCTLNGYSWFVVASNNELKQMQVSGYSPFEEKLNWLSHGLGALLAIVALVAMVLVSESITAVVATSVYGASLILMFVSSTLYHASVSDKAKRVLKKLDHSAIYLLIAGTYTPFLLLALGGYWAWIGMFAIWGLALFGVIFKLTAKIPRPRISLATYLVMGWIALAFIYPLYLALPGGAMWLLVLGGVLFSVGTLFYSAKHRHLSHAIWHLFVLVACTCHFLAIYLYII
ncbi:hemolysin III family protein [Pseudoalteromonas sp. CO325X]|uniref:PAQR family membrane homeostasis protein TrhA n=1 Tax=Pseudoalteromonas sp. CO325X TaxID=1777262 RepID=UPI003204EAFB|tara:strand:- start:99130 stop:99816 length:687 start_codon:yes stop_codon:yes gene_type:complete